MRNQLFTNQTLFWDVAIDELDTHAHKEFIISRILEEGDIETLRRLFEVYTEEEVKEVVVHSRKLSPKTGGLWKIYFNLDENPACMTKLSQTMPKMPWQN